MMILALAPNGAYKTKNDHKNLPISDSEIIKSTKSVLGLGVSMLHTHIRDENGKHSIDAKHYAKLLTKLKQELPQEIALQPTTEAANIFSADSQVQMLKELKPEFASIALREISRLENKELFDLFKWLKNNKVNPQIIIYTQTDADNYLKLMQKSQLSAKDFPVLVVIGKGENDFKNIEKIIATIKSFTTSIMLCGFAELEHQMIAFALEHNYHLRIGFENNLSSKNGGIATDNTQRIAEVLQEIKTKTTLANYEQTKQLLTPNWV
jgi:3-keto-5-aminohexanoate cleavage enzyme